MYTFYFPQFLMIILIYVNGIIIIIIIIIINLQTLHVRQSITVA
jgi:hypothetical protein